MNFAHVKWFFGSEVFSGFEKRTPGEHASRLQFLINAVIKLANYLGKFIFLLRYFIEVSILYSSTNLCNAIVAYFVALLDEFTSSR